MRRGRSDGFRSSSRVLLNPGVPLTGGSVQPIDLPAAVTCAIERMTIESPSAAIAESVGKERDQFLNVADAEARDSAPVSLSLLPGSDKGTCAVRFSDPKPVRAVEPDFLHAAGPTGHGSVAVGVDLDAAGNVTNSVLLESGGNAALDAVSEDAARRATYQPGVFGCKPYATRYIFRTGFTGNS